MVITISQYDYCYHYYTMLMLTCEGHLQAVMVVHHRCDTVKPEAVKLVLVNPPPCV